MQTFDDDASLAADLYEAIAEAEDAKGAENPVEASFPSEADLAALAAATSPAAEVPDMDPSAKNEGPDMAVPLEQLSFSLGYCAPALSITAEASVRTTAVRPVPGQGAPCAKGTTAEEVQLSARRLMTTAAEFAPHVPAWTVLATPETALLTATPSVVVMVGSVAVPLWMLCCAAVFVLLLGVAVLAAPKQ